MYLWHYSQKLVSKNSRTPIFFQDPIHRWTAPINTWLWTHERTSRALTGLSSLIVDFFAVYLIAESLFGRGFRVFLALFFVFFLRQICQLLLPLAIPDKMLWKDPGIPSLVVTYEVSNDFFFSGHTAIAVLAAWQMTRYNFPGVVPLALGLVAFEIAFVLATRSHYLLDVVVGIAAAFCGIELFLSV